MYDWHNKKISPNNQCTRGGKMGLDRIYMEVFCEDCQTEMKPGEILVSDTKCEKCRQTKKILKNQKT